MQDNYKIFERVKGLTLALAIVSTVFAVFSAGGTFFNFLIRSVDWFAIADWQTAMFMEELVAMSPTSTVYIVLFEMIFYTGFCVTMYILHRRLRKGQLVSKIPYYLPLAMFGINVLDVFIQLIIMSNAHYFINSAERIGFVFGYLFGSLFRLAYDGVVPVLAFIALRNLGKLHKSPPPIRQNQSGDFH